MPESRIVGQTVIATQMDMTQQFFTELPAGSPQDAHSSFTLHELGHEPPSDALPPDELPSPRVLPPDEPAAGLLVSTPPDPEEEFAGPEALLVAVLPEFSFGGYPYVDGGVLLGWVPQAKRTPNVSPHFA